MRVLEQFLQSKTGKPEDCEDAIFVGDHYIAVIDGATSKTGSMWDGKKAGRIAAEIILSTLPKLSPKLGPLQAVLTLDRTIVDWYRSHNVEKHMLENPAERCTASVVVYSKFRNQLWFVGDCQAFVDGKYFSNDKLIDKTVSEVRALFIEASLRAGKTVQDFQETDWSRELLHPLFVHQCFFQNSGNISKYDYTVIDGFFDHTVIDGFFKEQRPIKIVTVPADAKGVVLASDGYPKLASSLAESEKRLMQILTKDPLLFRLHKSTKGLQNGNVSYDDRAYVKFTLE